MNNSEQQQVNQQDAPSAASQGALIDASGQEIPITESMIQQACNQLDDSQADTKIDAS